VIIVGGTGVVSTNTENQIIALGISIKRIAGINRYETSKKVAEEIGTSSQVVIATGDNFPDALSISPIAASKLMPILLTKTKSIPDEIKSYLSTNTFSVSYVIGGPGVITDSVLTGLQNPKRLYGNNRYDTNIAVLKEFNTSLNLSNVYIATGKDFPDALATSALAPITSSPLILVGDTPEVSTKDYIKNNLSLITNSTEIGGPNIIPDAIIDIALNSHKPIYAIDIGHNATHDTGAVGIRTEDSCTKEVGTLVIKKLTDLGYTVINCSPTNPTSTTDSLKQRTDIANAAHADYYMSIHFNIFNGTASGSEAFFGSDAIKSKAQQVLANLASIGYINRGVNDNSRGLYVLSHTNMPAMLIECAFLDSVSDMAKYDANKIADALVNGLISGN
jgi:N-acetylmuramoyl-L-alanine amidase